MTQLLVMIFVTAKKIQEVIQQCRSNGYAELQLCFQKWGCEMENWLKM